MSEKIRFCRNCDGTIRTDRGVHCSDECAEIDTEPQGLWDRLERFARGAEYTTEELRDELSKEGIDPDDFVRKVRDKIGLGSEAKVNGDAKQ